jgi:hypothetical protein
METMKIFGKSFVSQKKAGDEGLVREGGRGAPNAYRAPKP